MARAQLHPRLVAADDAFEQQLDVAARRLCRREPRLDDPRVVEDEQVAGAQKRGRSREARSVSAASRRRAAGGCRCAAPRDLRDQLGRQRIVEILERVVA